MENKKSGLIITELFLVKPGNDFHRTFTGVIRREVDADGNPIVLGQAIVREGMIWSKARTEEELTINMDEVCKMKLDMGLHSNPGISAEICGFKYILN
jgi:hypothetical protein